MTFQLAAVDDPVVGEFLVARGRVREYVEFASPPVKVDYSTGEFVFLPAGNKVKPLGRLASAGHNDVCLCLSPDPEGDYLAWLLESFLSREWAGKPVHKMRLAALSSELLEAAEVVDAPVEPKSPMAVLARIELGERLNFHLRRTLGAAAGPGGMPLTVKAVAMAFAMAEMLGVNQSPTRRFTVEVSFASGLRAGLSEMLRHTTSGSFNSREQANACAAVLQKMEFTVNGLESEESVLDPPLPLTVAVLTDIAFKKYSLTPGRTRLILDTLAAGNGKSGWVSTGYPGCPDRSFLEEAIRADVAARHGDVAVFRRDFSPEAILPIIGAVGDGDNLTLEERELLGLVSARARAGQMFPLQEELLAAELVSPEGAVLTARGRRLSGPGFTAELSDMGRGDENSEVFSLEEGMKLAVERACVSEEIASSNEIDLNGFWEIMADMGIGPDRDSCQTLEQLIDLDYLALDSRAGISRRPRLDILVNGFSKAFPGFPPQALFPYLEQTVMEVAEGRKELAAAVSQFDQTLFVHGRALVNKKPDIKVSLENRRVSSRIIKGAAGISSPSAKETPAGEEEVVSDEVEESAAPAAIEEAPAPAGEIEEEAVIPGSKTGEGEEESGEWSEEVLAELARSEASVQSSDETVISGSSPAPLIEREETAAEAPECEKCGRPMLRMRHRYGSLWRCGSYPDCLSFRDMDGAGLPICPLCGRGAVVTQKTASGRLFYVCSEEACALTAWSPIHAQACRRCGHPFLVEKKKGDFLLLRCPRAGCGYERKPGQGDNKPAAGRRRVRVKRRASGATGRKVVRVVRRKKG